MMSTPKPTGMRLDTPWKRARCSLYPARLASRSAPGVYQVACIPLTDFPTQWAFLNVLFSPAESPTTPTDHEP